MRDADTEKERLFQADLETKAWGRVTSLRRASAFMVPMLFLLAFIWFIPEEGLEVFITHTWFWVFVSVFVLATFLRIMLWANKHDDVDFKRELAKVYSEYGLTPPER